MKVRQHLMSEHPVACTERSQKRGVGFFRIEDGHQTKKLLYFKIMQMLTIDIRPHIIVDREKESVHLFDNPGLSECPLYNLVLAFLKHIFQHQTFQILELKDQQFGPVQAGYAYGGISRCTE